MDISKIKSEMIVRLFEIDAVKFGNFVLKSKTTSPIYIDFRGIISSPDLMVLLPKADRGLFPVHWAPYTTLWQTLYVSVVLADSRCVRLLFVSSSDVCMH